MAISDYKLKQLIINKDAKALEKLLKDKEVSIYKIQNVSKVVEQENTKRMDEGKKQMDALKETYSYQKLTWAWLSKEFWQDMIGFLNKYKTDNKIKTMTDEDVKNAMLNFPVELRTKHSNDFDKFLRYTDIKWIETSKGSLTAKLVDDITDPDILKKKFDEVFNKVKDNPVFQKYWDSEFKKIQTKADYDIEDFNKLTLYAKDDYVKNLAKSDVYLADSLQKATETYGMRWLLWSWIQQIWATQTIQEWNTFKSQYKTDTDRLLDKYQTGISRAKEQLEISKRTTEAQKEKEQSILAIDEFNKNEKRSFDQVVKLL